MVSWISFYLVKIIQNSFDSNFIQTESFEI